MYRVVVALLFRVAATKHTETVCVVICYIDLETRGDIYSLHIPTCTFGVSEICMDRANIEST
jgi:hypothetical protein